MIRLVCDFDSHSHYDLLMHNSDSRIFVYSASTSKILGETDSTLANNEHCIEVAHALDATASQAKKPAITTIALYPNSTNGFLTIKTDVVIKVVEVFDLYARKVETIYENKEIDIPHLKAGWYAVKVITAENNVISTKILLSN